MNENQTNGETNFQIINGGTSIANDLSSNLALCYPVQLTDPPELMDPMKLFEGYHSIHAITFSYNLSFINSLMEGFRDGEIIIGAPFLTKKDPDIQQYAASVLANAEDAVKRLSSYKRLIQLAKEGAIEFRTPKLFLDHRKLYMLRADNGKTRVIISSANLSTTFTTGDRMEHYTFDDSPLAFEYFMNEFDTIWENSFQILDEMVTGKESEEAAESNPILKEVREPDKIVVLKRPEQTPLDIELVRYTIDKTKIDEKWEILIQRATGNNKNGLIKLTPKSIEQIDINCKRLKIRNRLRFIEKEEPYPTLKIDLDNNTVLLNGKPFDLNPANEEVCTSIEQLLDLFGNLDDFIDRHNRLPSLHYKAMVLLFASPFFSILRCEIYLRHSRTIQSLPLFLFETSPGSDCGKTFMLKMFLKMMTGLELSPTNYDDLAQRCGIGRGKQFVSISECLRTVIRSACSVPYFIDEINSQTLTKSIEPLLKNAESCEKTDNIGQPLLIFASNKMNNPEESERKRAVWFEFSGGLPSNIDRAAYQCRGDALYRSCTNTFYREYLRRIIPEVQKMLDYIKDERSKEWYPDLINISSIIIRSILSENGYVVPTYMRELTWYNDFNGNECAAEEAISQISDMYQNNRKAFSIKRETVSIMLGSDNRSKKMLENWLRVLPKEIDAHNESIRMDFQIKLNRQELEKRLGYKLKKRPFSRPHR